MPGLPDLSEAYAVDPAAIEGLRANGHTVVRGLAAPDEVAAYRPVIEAAVARHAKEAPPLEKRDTYGKAFLQITNLWRSDPGVARFTMAPRFARVAAELLGVEGIRLYHDQALFKEAGGGHTPYHQDQFYWPLDTSNTITMWMPLVDVPEEIGTMTFASGSHRLGHLARLGISDKSEAVYRDLIEARGLSLDTHGALAAGDATFHMGWTLHGAPPNLTGRLRSVMTVIYFADGARATEPDHGFQAHDLATWLPGVQPGELAASAINPRLWPPEAG